MRLQVNILPPKAPPNSPALYSFLEIAPPGLTLEQLAISIETRHGRLYPHRPRLIIQKLQDSDGNDLDLSYSVGDVFSDKSADKNSSIVRVVQTAQGLGRESSIPPGSSLRPRNNFIAASGRKNGYDGFRRRALVEHSHRSPISKNLLDGAYDSLEQEDRDRGVSERQTKRHKTNQSSTAYDEISNSMDHVPNRFEREQDGKLINSFASHPTYNSRRSPELDEKDDVGGGGMLSPSIGSLRSPSIGLMASPSIGGRTPRNKLHNFESNVQIPVSQVGKDNGLLGFNRNLDANLDLKEEVLSSSPILKAAQGPNKRIEFPTSMPSTSLSRHSAQTPSPDAPPQQDAPEVAETPTLRLSRLSSAFIRSSSITNAAKPRGTDSFDGPHSERELGSEDTSEDTSEDDEDDKSSQDEEDPETYADSPSIQLRHTLGDNSEIDGAGQVLHEASPLKKPRDNPDKENEREPAKEQRADKREMEEDQASDREDRETEKREENRVPMQDEQEETQAVEIGRLELEKEEETKKKEMEAKEAISVAKNVEEEKKQQEEQERLAREKEEKKRRAQELKEERERKAREAKEEKERKAREKKEEAERKKKEQEAKKAAEKERKAKEKEEKNKSKKEEIERRKKEKEGKNEPKHEDAEATSLAKQTKQQDEIVEGGEKGGNTEANSQEITQPGSGVIQSAASTPAPKAPAPNKRRRASTKALGSITSAEADNLTTEEFPKNKKRRVAYADNSAIPQPPAGPSQVSLLSSQDLTSPLPTSSLQQASESQVSLANEGLPKSDAQSQRSTLQLKASSKDSDIESQRNSVSIPSDNKSAMYLHKNPNYKALIEAARAKQKVNPGSSVASTDSAVNGATMKVLPKAKIKTTKKTALSSQKEAQSEEIADTIEVSGSHATAKEVTNSIVKNAIKPSLSRETANGDVETRDTKGDKLRKTDIRSLEEARASPFTESDDGSEDSETSEASHSTSALLINQTSRSASEKTESRLRSTKVSSSMERVASKLNSAILSPDEVPPSQTPQPQKLPSQTIPTEASTVSRIGLPKITGQDSRISKAYRRLSQMIPEDASEVLVAASSQTLPNKSIAKMAGNNGSDDDDGDTSSNSDTDSSLSDTDEEEEKSGDKKLRRGEESDSDTSSSSDDTNDGDTIPFTRKAATAKVAHTKSGTTFSRLFNRI